jgi:hypothetical protein
MPMTRSVQCLWLCSIAALACAAFSIGYTVGMREIVSIERLDVGGGQAFALSFCPLASMSLALLLCLFALAALSVSWLREAHPLLSFPHSVALLLLVPIAEAAYIGAKIWSSIPFGSGG